MTARQPALDGLRALAVLAVVGFHVVPAQVPSGTLGVEVFFVLSGFLITRLLLAEHRRTGGVRLGAFWVRRTRRLAPAQGFHITLRGQRLGLGTLRFPFAAADLAALPPLQFD